MSNIYTVGQVCTRTGLSYKQVDDMARKALLAPSVAVADGRGSRRLYNDRDLLLLRAVAVLRKTGIGRGTFASIMKALQSTSLANDEHHRKYIVVSGSKASVVSETALGQLVRKPCNLTVLLPLSVLTAEDE